MKQLPVRKLFLVTVCLLMLLCLVACEQATDAEKPSAAPAPAVDELAATDATEFSVSRAFSSNMVIQRDEPIRVWGWAPAARNGETVKATFLGKSAEGKIENGEWLVTFEEGFAVNAAMGNDMKITCGSDEVLFEDVLVGDVYMVIGQSNVAHSMANQTQGTGTNLSTLVDENAPIRLKYNTMMDTYGYPTRSTDEVCEDVLNGRPWWLPTVSNVRNITAIGYLFATEIVEKTSAQIPVGIIEVSGSGMAIGAFMSNEAAGEAGSDTYNKSTGLYQTTGLNSEYGSRFMYNHYMYPYEKYALAGVIWYQGESDCETKNANTYVNKFVTLMEYMRSTHNLKNKDFPVYVVEFPTIYNQPADYTGTQAWAAFDFSYIRAEMGIIPQRLSNCYVSASSDVNADDHYWNNLHPLCKDKQAERLADIAGAVWYGIGTLDEAAGPILKSYENSEDRKTITLTFTNVGEGLTTADGGTAVTGFCPFNRAGAVDKHAKLTATITAPDQITITSSKAMYGISYNCQMEDFYGKTINLCNKNGKIAAGFSYFEERMNQVRHELVGDGVQYTALAGEDTLAIHFSTTGTALTVGTQLINQGNREASVTLSLYAFNTDYATTVAADPLVAKTFTDLNDHAWAELEFGKGSILRTGEYLLVLSNASGVTVKTGGAHESQVTYKSGAYTEGASLLLGVSYENAVEKVYSLPVDPNVPVETEPVETTAPEADTTVAADSATDSAPADNGTTEPAADESGCASVVASSAAMALMALCGAAVICRKKQD